MAVILATGGRAIAEESTEAPSADPGAPALAYAEVWLAVRINGVAAKAPARLARRQDGRLLATAADLARWRIRVPEVAPVTLRDRRYFPLDAVAGLAWQVDEREQVLFLDGRPEVFAVTVLAPRGSGFRRPDAVAAGGFFNYDLQASAQDGAQALDGLLEFGAFNRHGFGTATFLGHQGGATARRLVRLDTAWTLDDPSKLASLSVGDGTGRAGAWGRSVRFGGVQWATNFATRPDFVPFPLPTVKGEAVLPSTVDLYVDNALRLSRSVPYGPFEIPRAPVISGDGQVRLVVRDALGRETVITQPYYVSAGLLQAGLHDEAYELGFTRRNYASASNDYGRLFGAATHRVGLDDRSTAEVRGEWQGEQQTVGAAASRLVAGKAVASVAFALSHRPDGSGSLLSLGIERQGRPLSFGLETRLATSRFAQLGGWPEFDAPRRVQLARTSFAAGRGGSVYASYVRQVGHEGGNARFVSAGYNAGLADRLYLSVFGLRALSGDRAYTVGVNFTWALGARTTAGASRTWDANDSASAVQIQQSLPQGSGVGYRVLAGSGAGDRSQATLLLQNAVGTYSLEAARSYGSNGYRAGASGGLAFLGGHAYPSRRIDDSFAVVKVGDYAGIDVYLDNQPVARTNDAGYALLTRLRPYQSNVVAIQPERLPLDAEIADLRLELTPARRSAASADFPVRPARAALLRIVLDDGAPLPAGAVVSVVDRAEEFPVARRGEAYVKGLAHRSIVRARWQGQHCDIEVSLPEHAGPLPVLGPLSCRGVRP